MHDMWELKWGDVTWRDRFEEEWQRLTIRLYIAGAIANNFPNDDALRDTADKLQEIIVIASHSAAVGRLMVGEFFDNDP
jgi:hypothetical protein